MTFQTWQNSVSDHLQSLWAQGICVGELEFNLFKQSERLLKGFQGEAIKTDFEMFSALFFCTLLLNDVIQCLKIVCSKFLPPTLSSPVQSWPFSCLPLYTLDTVKSEMFAQFNFGANSFFQDSFGYNNSEFGMFLMCKILLGPVVLNSFKCWCPKVWGKNAAKSVWFGSILASCFLPASGGG